MKLSIVLILIATAVARADDEPAQPAQPAQPDPPGDAAKVKLNAEAEAHIRALEKKIEKLEQDLADQKDDHQDLADKVKSLLPLAMKFGGYVDLGAFKVTGNGAGTREDYGHVYFPEYANVPDSWVFMGDPLSTMINSRGDVADTGQSRAITYDPIHAGSASTFLVNAVNFQMFSGIGETAALFTSMDFLPRGRDISDPGGLFVGDYLDVKLAYASWKPRLDAFNLELQAGKFDSVLGYEYRSIDSPDRLNVTPSLICRYTCGHPIGLKARARFLGDALIANVAVTNGSSFSEGFDFSDETDKNDFKTLSGRLSYQIAKKLEFGVSGAYGAQDWQPSDSVIQWHAGADMHFEAHDVEFTAELVHGRANGQTSATAVAACDIAPCLHYWGAYGLVGYRVSNTLVPYARIDWRDALHESGASFVYISDEIRFMLGMRAEIGTRLILKAEYTVNRELGRLPQFPDDILTSALVIKY